MRYRIFEGRRPKTFHGHSAWREYVAEMGVEAMKSVLDTISVFGRIHPDHPAVMLSDSFITYRTLSKMIDSLTSVILSLKLDRNRLVGILVLNSAHHLALNLALAKAGYSSTSLTIGTLKFAAVNDVQCIIADKSTFDTDVPIIKMSTDWFTRNVSSATVRPTGPVENDKIVKVSFTSGSTGNNKAIAFTEQAMFYRLRDTHRKLIGSEDRLLCLFGIESNVGLMCSLSALQNGHTLCLSRRLDEAIPMLKGMAITCVTGSVSHLTEIADIGVSKGTRFGGVRKIVSAGSFFSEEAVARVQASFPGDIYDIYASTEGGSAGVNLRSIKANQTMAGRFCPCADIEVAKENESDEFGELIIHSQSRAFEFKGLTSDIQQQKREPFAPGDLGHIGDDGWLVISGRSDNLLNFGGIKRTSEQVETTLARCGLISDAAVIRIDSGGGPKIVLTYTPAPGFNTERFTEWRQSHLKGLRFDRFEAMASIPRNENGKIDRKGLRSSLAQ